MKYTSVDIRFEGKEFYPSKLGEKIQIPIKVLAEYGKISSKGRYKGKPSPYGIGVLEILPTEKQNNIYNLIDDYSSKLLNNKNELGECGVEEIIFDIETPKDFPSEFSLSQNIVRNLSALNARIEFHTINDKEEELKNKDERVKSILHYLHKDELYQPVLSSLLKYPSMYDAKGLYYIIYLFTRNQSSTKPDDNLREFENFYNEVVNH